MNFVETIYIDGQQRSATELSERFYVDTPELPGCPCSCHSLDAAAVAHLRSGGAVRTSGRLYSLRDPAPSATPLPRPRFKRWAMQLSSRVLGWASR